MPIAKLENIKLNYLEIIDRNDEQPEEINDREWENILMIHGLATNLAFWYPIANKLTISKNNKRVKTRIILFDLPGHGRSSTPLSGYKCTDIAHHLNELVSFLNLDKFHLIAHSFGGSVAVDFIHQFPQKIKTLTLADVRLKSIQPKQTLDHWQNGVNLQQQFQKIGINLPAEDPEIGFQILTEMAKLQVKQKENNDSAADKFSGADFTNFIPQQQNVKTAKKWLKLIETTEAMKEFCQPELITKDELKQIRQPIFLAYGSNSPNLITQIELAKLDNFNHHYIVENAGHFFPLSRADLFQEKISNFLINHIY